MVLFWAKSSGQDGHLKTLTRWGSRCWSKWEERRGLWVKTVSHMAHLKIILWGEERGQCGGRSLEDPSPRLPPTHPAPALTWPAACGSWGAGCRGGRGRWGQT